MPPDMASEPSTGTLLPTRNRTVVTAHWVLSVIAVIEIILAAVAMAPRVASGMRSGIASLPAAIPASPAPGAFQPTQSSMPPQQASVPSQTPQESIDQSSAIPSNQTPQDAMATGGPSLQIVNAKLLGSSEGSKKLQVSIKSNTREKIDVPQVKVQVYFYDQDNGEIVPSKAQVTSTWLSPPVDWKKGEPELLEVQYLPDGSSTDVSFAGYLVAIYYKGDLQDCRAEPGRLKKLFAPKYYIGSEE